MLEQQIVVTSLFKYGGYFRGRETTIIITLNKLENISGMIGWQNTGNLVSVCKGIIGLVQRRR